MASFVARCKTVSSQQRVQFKTYPSLLGSTVAQLWQLLTQLSSTYPIPRCQISSIPMAQIWILEIPLGAYNSGTMTFSVIMSKSLFGYRPKTLKGLSEREIERLFAYVLASSRTSFSRLPQVMPCQFPICSTLDAQSTPF